MNKNKVLIIAGMGLLITLLLFFIAKSWPDSKENISGELVSLAADQKDITQQDVKEQFENPGPNKPNDIESSNNEGYGSTTDEERIQELIRKSDLQGKSLINPQPDDMRPGEGNSKSSSVRIIEPTQASLDSVINSIYKKKGVNPTVTTKKKRIKKNDTAEPHPEKSTLSRFNTVSLAKSQKKNAVKAYVHSTQTVTTGATLKMRIGEDCYTDDDVFVKKDSPVFGEVKSVDGERIIIEIKTVNVNGSILPFHKDVYSTDAIKGIYVPGNTKSDINKDAQGGAVDGANMNVMGGMGIGSQLVAGAANGVIGATKQASSKNIKRTKVTIKTNYAVYLMENKQAEMEE